MIRTNHMTSTKSTVVAVATIAAALALSACGGSTNTSSGSSATSAAGANGGQAPGQRAGRVPGTSGLIADVQGTTMQVQGATEQIAVTFTTATKVTKTVAGTASSVTVGSCVVVRDGANRAGATGATASATPATAVTATTIEVSQPAKSGACTGAGFGAGLGGGPGAGGTQPQGGPPTGAPTGAGARAGAAGFGVVGTVTAVNGAVLTVYPQQRRQAAGASATSSATVADVAVTTTASTTYTVTQKGSTADVKVGECVTATGKADDTGTVAATALALRAATNGQCTTGRRATGAAGTATTNG